MLPQNAQCLIEVLISLLGIGKVLLLDFVVPGYKKMDLLYQQKQREGVSEAVARALGV